MSSLLLDIEIGVSELLLGVTTLFVTYLAWQWWNARKVSTSGYSSGTTLQPMNMKGTAGTKGANGASSSSDAAAKLPLAIFFGSQSGTAETFAHELAAEGKLYGFKAVVHDLQDYDVDSLADETFCVFLLATFGEGDPTDNAAEFYAWITKDEREKGMMAGVTFGVFALGNRQYEHFCNIGRRVDQRMNELGGTRLLEHGEGDDDGSLEDDFSSWKSTFWSRTKATFGLQNESAAAALFKSSFNIDWKPAETASKYIGGLTPSICDPKHKPILANVVSNRQLRSDVPEGENFNAEGESTRHLDLDVSSLRLSYVTADNLGVCPRNDYKLVGHIINRLRVKGNSVFGLKALGKRKPPVPSPCSVQDAFLWYLDFTSIPRASLLTLLAQYTEDEKEKAQLHAWTHDAKDEFHKMEYSILEVLDLLPNLSVPFLDFLEFCPKIQPRFYTISSSSLVHPKQVSITVALSTHHRAGDKARVYNGLATTYLCGLREGKDQVCVFLRPSTFRLPKPKRIFVNGSPTNAAPTTPQPSDSSSSSISSSSSPAPSPVSSPAPQSILPPVIMVGPGTGVAPFRAFIQEFAYLRSKNLPSFPETHLYFGCRNRKQDFIYHDEMVAAVENGSLTKLNTAFSRETDQKVYVQSDLKAHSELIWTLLNQQRAYFYVCGGTVMGRQVKEIIQQIAEQHGSMTQQAASEYVKKLHTDGRYVQELWS